MNDLCLRRSRRIAALAGALALIGVGILWSAASPVGEARAAGCAPAPDYLATAPATDAAGNGGSGGVGGAGGIGGTGRTGEGTGGIGGTGRGEEGNEGGIGGTGIVGTVTGFASVCLNGLEVHYDDAVPVSENGRPSSIRALAVGQVIAVQAAPGARGLTAQRIEVMHALEGPVTRSENGRFEVMGAPVVAAAATVGREFGAVRAGDWVQVDGHRDGTGAWVATRVARIEPRPEVTIQGEVDSGERVAGVRVEAAGATAPVAVGERRLVRGEWLPGESGSGRLRIRESRAAPASDILARSGRWIVETRVRQAKDGRVRTGQPEIDAMLVGQPMREGDLVRLSAHRSADGRIAVERLERSSKSGRDATRDAGKHESKRHEEGKERRQEGDSNRNRDADRERNDADRKRNDTDRERNDADRGGRSERSERSEKLERVENSERTEKIEIERAEKTEQRVDRSDRRGRD